MLSITHCGETKMDLLIILVYTVVIFGCGYWYSQYRTLQVQIRALRALKERLTELKEKTIAGILLTHEIVNNVHYFYSKEDDTFICQGNTLEEAATRYSELNKDSSGCFVHSVDGKLYCFFNGKVLENNSFEILKA